MQAFMKPYSTDPLDWWPRHEKLLPAPSRMARQFLGVPALSAHLLSNGLFRGVGQDFAKRRQAMSEQTLEEITWAEFTIVSSTGETGRGCQEDHSLLASRSLAHE